MDVALLKQYAAEGLTRKAISEKMGMSYSRTTTVLREQGIDVSREKPGFKERGPRKQTLQILELRREGLTYKQISEELGCCKHTVSDACVKYGLKTQGPPITEQQAIDIISKAGYEYVSGFYNAHSKVTVRCRECGKTFEKMYRCLREKAIGTYQNEMRCPHCWRKEVEEYRKKKNEPKEREARIKAEQRARKEADLISRQTEERLAIHVCKNCGIEYCIGTTGYNSKQYCSEKCMKRWAMRIKNDRRVRRMNARNHDTDITLEKLFSRDGGVCYLCGEPCRWDDIVDGNAGNRYPSIDHVRPLSKGGTHTWNNVKLACRFCNTMKGNRG